MTTITDNEILESLEKITAQMLKSHTRTGGMPALIDDLYARVAARGGIGNTTETIPSTKIPFDNGMVLVESLTLNKIMDVVVKARGPEQEITVQDTNERVRVPGISIHFPWYKKYGTPPSPGDWISISARLLKYDDVMADTDEYKKEFSYQYV